MKTKLGVKYHRVVIRHEGEYDGLKLQNEDDYFIIITDKDREDFTNNFYDDNWKDEYETYLAVELALKKLMNDYFFPVGSEIKVVSVKEVEEN
jgi:predicted GTPase